MRRYYVRPQDTLHSWDLKDINNIKAINIAIILPPPINDTRAEQDNSQALSWEKENKDTSQTLMVGILQI